MTKKQKPIITSRPKPKTIPDTFKVADIIADKPDNTASGPDNDLGKAPLEGELLPLAPNTPKSTPLKFRGKQQLFVDAYLIEPNATKAAITAGYSKKTAQQMGAENLLKPVIKAAIEEAQAELSKKSMMDAVEVVNNTAIVVKTCMQKTLVMDGKGRPIMVTGEDGDPVEAYGMLAAQSALKGLDQLSRYYGLYDKGNRQRAGAGGATVFTGIEITFVNADHDPDAM